MYRPSRALLSGMERDCPRGFGSGFSGDDCVVWGGGGGRWLCGVVERGL